MSVYFDIADFKSISHAVLTIGTFDGVHLGHRKIISRMVDLAKKSGGETVLLTFFPHPRTIIHPQDISLKSINSLDEKIKLLTQLGISHVIVTPFSRDFSNLSPQQYIKEILVDRIGAKHLVIGYDHRFGKNRLGGLHDLKQYATAYAFELEEISEQEIHAITISSTKIREALLKGDIAFANELLGYTFFVTGRVIKGDKIGRTIGYPTANIYIQESDKLIPADGVYAVSVTLDNQSFKGMAYIGNRPTINGMTRNVEVNIFDFTLEIYGQMLQMNFEAFIREDVKFNNLDELKNQLSIDKQTTLHYFESIKN